MQYGMAIPSVKSGAPAAFWVPSYDLAKLVASQFWGWFEACLG
jgi:hypothetical protein